VRAALAALVRSVLRLFGSGATPDPIVRFEPDDAEMRAAIAEARASLPAFLANPLDAEGYSATGSCVKVGFDVDAPDMNIEYIWVGPFRRLDAERFAGALANAPNALPAQHLGDVVPFTFGMIYDWNLPDGGGRYWGDFTTRVVASQMRPAEAAALRARFLDPPVPAERRAP
jgi:uncharacterized protein YegJ (DUF2314 family)